MTTTTKQRLSVNNAPDVHFEGQLIAEYTTQNASGTKDRWSEIRLWETAAGTWIVENVGCSRRQGESDLRDVLVLDESIEESAPIGAHDSDEEMSQFLREKVMAFLGWTTVAKAFAREAGWDVIRRVD